MSVRTATAVIVAGFALITAACSSSGAEPQRLTVRFDDTLIFDPPSLTVRAGRPVSLTVRNTGSVDHDFYLRGMPARDVTNAMQGGHGHEEAGVIAGHPKAGAAVIVRFTPVTTGTYEFWCSVTGHKEAGMRGLLIVS